MKEKEEIEWMTSHYYDGVAEEYDGSYMASVDVVEDELHKKIIGRHIDSSSWVIDIGCGTGHALTLMPTAPHYYIGVDPSIKMLEIAREKFPDRGFYMASAEELFDHLTPEEFHIALATYEVMNYVDMSPYYFARELARIASRGCIVSVASPLHIRRDAFTRDAPGKSHWCLDEVRSGFAMNFPNVKITGFSSPLHDALPQWALDIVGVRCPARWSYYWLVEAWR